MSDNHFFNYNFNQYPQHYSACLCCQRSKLWVWRKGNTEGVKIGILLAILLALWGGYKRQPKATEEERESGKQFGRFGRVAGVCDKFDLHVYEACLVAEF